MNIDKLVPGFVAIMEKYPDAGTAMFAMLEEYRQLTVKYEVPLEDLPETARFITILNDVIELAEAMGEE